ncbi:E3 ubiquitin-protein ligase SHPRH [Aplysia californica]|uniref:E3 ubiquitin-protein ligase SHPRH n=1 Tax=Aplysia californica TaxID=6500 RepID=A0ABM0JA25_APLCA|nr:E3 ubiquitin-protein ligase SHPRH [Aplysia californica]XP_035825574.1 E3 ubiquitin-protein ligase SHPRH [Aplysia californica]
MGKRKQRAPQHAGVTKRQQLTWNLSGQASGSGSDSFINDHTLRNENLNQSGLSPECGLSASPQSGEGSSGSHTPVHALCVDAFYQNLASCHSTVTLHCSDSTKVQDVKNKTELLEFGTFKISLVAHPKLTPLPEQLPDFKECWLYLANEDKPSMLYFETEDNNENVDQPRKTKSRQSKFGVFWFVKLNVPVQVLSSLRGKSFLLLCDPFDTHEKELKVTIYGCESIVLKLSHPSEVIRIKVVQVAIQKLMEFYFDISLPYDYEKRVRTTGHDFFHLYESVMFIHKAQLDQDQAWEKEVAEISHDCLKPKLRHYQKQSVAWMLRQEKRNYDNREQQTLQDLHPLYCEVQFRNGAQLYYNRHGGSLIKDRPKAIPLLPGGILADEMGLGKTVEVLCCMLLHPRQDLEPLQALPVLADSETYSTVPSPDVDKLNGAKDGSEMPKDELVLNGVKDAVKIAQENSDCVDQSEAHLSGDKLLGKDEYLLPSCSYNAQDVETSDDLFAQSLCVGLKSCESVKECSDMDKESVPGSNDNGYSHSVVSDSLKSGTVKMEVPLNILSTSEHIGEIQFHVKESLDLCGESDMDTDSGAHTKPGSVPDGNELKQTLDDANGCGVSDSLTLAENKAQISLLDGSRIVTTVPSSLSSAEGSGAHSSAATSAEQDNTLQSSQRTSEGSCSSGKKRAHRKSRGYVEYVPVSSEDTSYFNTKPAARKQFFECNCGQLENEAETSRRGLHTVSCLQCGMSQHAECMNYDLTDPLRGDYLCPHCHALSSTIKSGATLIISPYSICHQWIEEIRKHIKECSIKVFIYTGVSKLGYTQPQTLAQQDIVITTYDVLRKEVDYANLPHTNSESGRRFRHPKRFLATPSPMVAVEWWRICLDEAQMVECVTTKTAEMALRLKAVNRWCVTGTPLMRSVEDIYGLLLFLGMDPLLVQQWFKLLVWEPFCHGFSAPMHHALSQVLWRTAKKDVIDQIDLPAQSEEVNWLTFSPVEEHFYRRQYEIYERNAYIHRRKVQNNQDPNTKLHALDRKTMNELLSPLFRLRQACCHPQIVRGEFLPLNRKMMTMEKVLEHMTKKVKTECEEAHRQIVASLNGLAGLAILRGKLLDAVDKYREVLRSVEEHKERFRTDDLQQLHAMHNLAWVLDSKPEGLAPTMRDASLKEQCRELKDKYMNKATANIGASREALDSSQANITEVNQKLQGLDGDWWADVVEMTVQRGIDPDLMDKVKDDLLKTSSTEGTIADSFTNTDGLMYVVDSHLQALIKARSTLTSALEKLVENTSALLVQTAATCCLRPVEEILKSCPFCKVDEQFNEYESKLFLFVERGVTVTGDDNSMAYQVSTKRQGTWADSEVEKALKSILSFYKLNFEPDGDITEAASIQIKYLDTLKKEFKHLRAMWLAHREQVSAIDELEMATERLRLRKNFEPEAATKILNVIEEREMTQHELKCSSDEIVSRDELRKKLGQLVYLTNLASQNEAGKDHNIDGCPICQCELGLEWSVLMCGHCYCLRCIRALIDRNLIGGNIQDKRLKCPVCRSWTPVREISYVTTKKTEKVNVKGSHSTKVQAVIECLIKIKDATPNAKSLVFSAWVSVLDILAAALAENNIMYKSLHDPNSFQKNLSAFKSEDAVQVLLLPLHSGANGLNLVEASNVLLVEPGLSLEEEAQAISRVYRIGQTRQTKIHRFLVRGTIEERIFHMVKTLRNSKSGLRDEEEGVELTVGHISSLLQQPSPDEDDSDENDDIVLPGSSSSGAQSSGAVSGSVGDAGAGGVVGNGVADVSEAGPSGTRRSPHAGGDSSHLTGGENMEMELQQNSGSASESGHSVGVSSGAGSSVRATESSEIVPGDACVNTDVENVSAVTENINGDVVSPAAESIAASSSDISREHADSDLGGSAFSVQDLLPSTSSAQRGLDDDDDDNNQL